jgi:hypothetical protein
MPAGEIQQKLGVALGELREGSVGEFPIVCAWANAGPKGWSLSARPHTAAVSKLTFTGVPCGRSGGTDGVIAYCANQGEGGVGGNVVTRRYSMIVSAGGISIDQYVQVLMPILARTGG